MKVPRSAAIALSLAALAEWAPVGVRAQPANGPGRDLWAHDNLAAWCVVPFDARSRSPEERAEMLARLGFRFFAYDWREKDIPTFDAEIEALHRHGVRLLAWWFPFDADDPPAKATLEVFRRHGVHPQLWVALSPIGLPRTPEELSRLPKTPGDQEALVRRSSERIAALVRLADPYGCRVELYNHNGWFGMVDNELAVIGRLEQAGVENVGLVYNFSHARDALHDDSRDFSRLWARMKGHVAAVNITGMHWEGQEVYPSQGDSELEMMRAIAGSGWRGPVGLIAEKGGDAETTLRNYLTGLDWLAAELNSPGSGGPRPFPAVAAVPGGR